MVMLFFSDDALSCVRLCCCGRFLNGGVILSKDSFCYGVLPTANLSQTYPPSQVVVVACDSR